MTSVLTFDLICNEFYRSLLDISSSLDRSGLVNNIVYPQGITTVVLGRHQASVSILSAEAVAPVIQDSGVELLSSDAANLWPKK